MSIVRAGSVKVRVVLHPLNLSVMNTRVTLLAATVVVAGCSGGTSSDEDAGVPLPQADGTSVVATPAPATIEPVVPAPATTTPGVEPVDALPTPTSDASPTQGTPPVTTQTPEVDPPAVVAPMTPETGPVEPVPAPATPPPVQPEADGGASPAPDTDEQAPESTPQESSAASDIEVPEPEPMTTTPVATAPEPTTSGVADDDSLPPDCLVAIADDGTRYCYTVSTRELLAIRPDGRSLWRFTLPGNDAVNDIRSITLAQGYLVILAATAGDSGRGLEFSTFEPSGAFVATHAIEPGGHLAGGRLDPSDLAIYGTDRALYLSGALIDDGTGQGATVADSVLARYDATNGALEAWRGTAGDRARELVDPAGPDAPLSVSRDGAPEGIDPWLVSPSTTPLVNTDTWETHLLLARNWFSGEHLARALETIDDILPPEISFGDSAFNGPAVACPGGGTLEATGFGNRVSELRFIYRSCRTDGALIDGTVVNTFGGGDGGGTRTDANTFLYENFIVRLDDTVGTRFEIDGEIRYSESTTRYVCVSRTTTWSVDMDRFIQTSEREALTVRSSRTSKTVFEQTGPAPGPPGGPACAPETLITEEAIASLAPSFAPTSTLSIRFDGADNAEPDGAQLAVRADDGSSVVVSGRLDGTRADRVSYGSDGGRSDVLVRGLFRPDLTTLPNSR